MFRTFLILFLVVNLKGTDSIAIKDDIKFETFLKENSVKIHQTTDQNEFESITDSLVKNELNNDRLLKKELKKSFEVLEDFKKDNLTNDVSDLKPNSPIANKNSDSSTLIIVIAVVVGVGGLIIVMILLFRTNMCADCSNGEKFLCCIACCEATRCCLECAAICADSNSSNDFGHSSTDFGGTSYRGNDGGLSSGFSGTSYRGNDGGLSSGFSGTSYR